MRRARILLLTAALVALPSCMRSLVREVHVESLSIETHGLSGVDATVRMSNAADRELRFESIEGTLFYDRGEVLCVTLHAPVAVAPHWAGDVRLRCRMRVPDRAALYAVRRKLARGEMQRMRVSLSMRIGVGTAVKKIVRRSSLSDFLDTFGVESADLLNDFGE